MSIEFVPIKPGVWHYGCSADDRRLSITLSRSESGVTQAWMCEIILEECSPPAPLDCATVCDADSDMNSSPTYRCTWGLPVERVVPQAKFEVEAINRWERLPFIHEVLAPRWVFKR